MFILYKGMDKILKQLIDENLTQPQIAEKLKKSVSQVRRLLRKFGLRTNRYVDHNTEAKTRVCRYCGSERLLEEFPLAAVINGETYRRWKCETCYVKMKVDRKRKIADWLEDLKKQRECEKCGNDDFRVLDFHHRGDKEFNVSDGTTRGFSRKKILEEIEKCEVLCANCHRILHYEEFGV